MKRLLIIGDSLPLPSEELHYDSTWIYHLKRKCPELDIVDKCVRARSVITLMHGGPQGKAKNLFEWYSPNYIIIHMGLPDCAPRLLPRKSIITKIINYSPFAKLIYFYFRKYRGRRIEYADVSPKEFKENLDNYVKRVAPIPVGIVHISKVTEVALKKSPRFNESIELYNKHINEVISNNQNAYLIGGLDASDITLYQSDGMHLSSSGQKIIFQNCYQFINSLIQ